MLKVGAKIYKPVQRYFTKNTVRAKYDRNMDAAMVSGIVGVAEFIKMPVWEPQDIGIFFTAAAVYLRSTALSLKYLLELQPIRKRAIRLKKFLKLQEKLQKRAAKQIKTENK